jgi:hypothetical protein
MASSNDVIFSESMADILANPIDICFGYAGGIHRSSRLPRHRVTSNQQVETDLLAETHPPTPRDLIAGLDRVEDMISTRSRSANAPSALT